MFRVMDGPLHADAIDSAVANWRGYLERSALGWVVNLAAHEFPGNPGFVAFGARDSESRELRHVAIYLAHTTLQIPESACAAAVGLHKSQAARAVQAIEQRRCTDANFNLKIERLETRARDALPAVVALGPVPPTQGLGQPPAEATPPAAMRDALRAGGRR